MTAFVATFITVSTIAALGTLTFVAVDIIISRRKDTAPAEAAVVVPLAVAAEPVEEVAAPIVIPIIDHVDAEEADAMISDEIALTTARTENGAGHGRLGIINIGDIDRAFNAGDVITLRAMKEKMLVSAKLGRIKILADGILTKPLTVKAESFSVQAIKMIELTGGTVIILKD